MTPKEARAFVRNASVYVCQPAEAASANAVPA